MNRTYNLLLTGLQAALTFVVTVSMYMVAALLDSDFGFDGLFGLVLIHPVIAAILSLLSIGLCFLAGLPIRVNKKINNWWIDHFYISPIVAMAGLTCFGMAWLPAFQETVTVFVDGYETIKQFPNSILVCTGWFLTTFFLLHLYPPAAIIRKAKGGILIMNVWKKIKR